MNLQPRHVHMGQAQLQRRSDGDEATAAPVYRFTRKHEWAIQMNFMTGIGLAGWVRVLQRHWRDIDYRWYWHRVLFLSVMAVLNSLFGLMDWLIYGRAIAAQPLNTAPLIILGHPRTGTTHLHNLLAQDPRFAYVSTFQAGCPHFFICASPFKWLWSPLLAPTRPMDNMALHWDLPAEDEIATTVVSGGISPYMSIVFPRVEAAKLRSLYTFEAASPEEREAWESAFLWVMRKVTFFASGCRHGAQPKPLLIKSPVHTARIKLLLRIFPDARFVFIHRHPERVFQSAAHMADTYYYYTHLHRPSDADVTEFIFSQYELLYEQYMAQRVLVPRGKLVELSFKELDEASLETLRSLYKAFGWDFGPDIRQAVAAYASSLVGFKQNSLAPLPAELQSLVRCRWGFTYEPFGYALGA